MTTRNYWFDKGTYKTFDRLKLQIIAIVIWLRHQDQYVLWIIVCILHKVLLWKKGTFGEYLNNSEVKAEELDKHEREKESQEDFFVIVFLLN